MWTAGVPLSIECQILCGYLAMNHKHIADNPIGYSDKENILKKCTRVHYTRNNDHVLIITPFSSALALSFWADAYFLS